MVWYFNFCSPHLADDATVNINRMAMVCQLLAAVLLTFILHMFAQLYQKDHSQQQAKHESQNSSDAGDKQMKDSDENDLDKDFGHSAVSLNHKNLIADGNNFEVTMQRLNKSEIMEQNKEGGFFSKGKVFFLTVETVENRAPSFLGHFTIALATCVMYSPFIYQTIMGLAYVIVCVLMIIFDAWKCRKSLVVAVALSYIFNIGLIISAIIGLGLANWDEFNISCYYTQLNM